MGRFWPALAFLAATVPGLAGCASTEPQLKPTRPPEEYTTPPDNDARYNKPIEYPKDLMDRDALQAKAKKDKAMPQGGPPMMGASSMPGGNPMR